jgi:3D (Asp-Asp-Asp) domain-containing protein/peptidoglycan hydrolase CwlO-like protein
MRTKSSNLLRSPAVQARLSRLLAAALVAALAAFILPAATGAGPSASELKREQGELAASSRSALLELYALEGELATARARLASVRARAEAVERERADAVKRLRHAKTILRRSEAMLAVRVRALYEEGDVDPLAVLLGAESIDDALTGLDGLRFAAGQDARIAAQARGARSDLTALARRLAARAAEAKRLYAAAEERTAALELARAERRAYLDRIAQQQRLNGAQLASLQRRATAAQATSRAVTEAAALAPDAPQPAPPPVAVGPTLTVVATAYALRGRTASGMPTGYGIAAVDPSVIPLGTRLTVPGYGTAVAADTGPAIRGARIDLWFPSVAQALAWGTRTVTIRLG